MNHQTLVGGLVKNISVFHGINPFTLTSDQDRISPYNINTISTSQVMRMKKNINYGIIS